MWLHSPHLHLFLLFLETEYKLLMLNKSPYRGWRGDAGVMERDCSWEQHLQVNTVFNPEKKWLLLHVYFSLLKEQNAPWTLQLCSVCSLSVKENPTHQHHTIWTKKLLRFNIALAKEGTLWRKADSFYFNSYHIITMVS